MSSVKNWEPYYNWFICCNTIFKNYITYVKLSYNKKKFRIKFKNIFILKDDHEYQNENEFEDEVEDEDEDEDEYKYAVDDEDEDEDEDLDKAEKFSLLYFFGDKGLSVFKLAQQFCFNDKFIIRYFKTI